MWHRTQSRRSFVVLRMTGAGIKNRITPCDSTANGTYLKIVPLHGDPSSQAPRDDVPGELRLTITD